MIKRLFSRQHLYNSFTQRVINKSRCYFSSAVKILRESDELSLEDIENILGNEPSQLQKKEEKAQ
jgi:hypothetical protein